MKKKQIDNRSDSLKDDHRTNRSLYQFSLLRNLSNRSSSVWILISKYQVNLLRESVNLKSPTIDPSLGS